MITSIVIGDEVVTTKEQYDIPVGTRATVKEICWIDLESLGDVKFCIGVVFPDNIYDEYGISDEHTWAYYNTEIEIAEKK